MNPNQDRFIMDEENVNPVKDYSKEIDMMRAH